MLRPLLLLLIELLLIVTVIASTCSVVVGLPLIADAHQAAFICVVVQSSTAPPPRRRRRQYNSRTTTLTTLSFTTTSIISLLAESTPSQSPIQLGNFADIYDGPIIPDGRVPNITLWVTWSDRSLSKLSDDGKGGLYDRINSILLLEEKSQEHGQSDSDRYNNTAITTPQQIHESTRFAVLSHGNQTDPIYNYVNAAGFAVFRWPPEKYYMLPSRYSAPDGINRKKRAEIIDTTVAKDNVTYIEEAVRVRYPNETVTLRDAILWNVYDDGNNRVGQTVLFDETLCTYTTATTTRNRLDDE